MCGTSPCCGRRTAPVCRPPSGPSGDRGTAPADGREIHFYDGLPGRVHTVSDTGDLPPVGSGSEPRWDPVREERVVIAAHRSRRPPPTARAARPAPPRTAHRPRSPCRGAPPATVRPGRAGPVPPRVRGPENGFARRAAPSESSRPLLPRVQLVAATSMKSIFDPSQHLRACQSWPHGCCPIIRPCGGARRGRAEAGHGDRFTPDSESIPESSFKTLQSYAPPASLGRR